MGKHFVWLNPHTITIVAIDEINKCDNSVHYCCMRKSKRRTKKQRRRRWKTDRQTKYGTDSIFLNISIYYKVIAINIVLIRYYAQCFLVGSFYLVCQFTRSTNFIYTKKIIHDVHNNALRLTNIQWLNEWAVCVLEQTHNIYRKYR